MGRYIKLILTTNDTRSESTIKSPNINDAMIEAARELEYTMMTGERWKPAKSKTKAKTKRAKK